MLASSSELDEAINLLFEAGAILGKSVCVDLECSKANFQEYFGF
jgi:hypothetical protein